MHNRWVHHQATVNGVRLHYVEAGTGPLVLLLHGFPDFWYSWRYQLPALAAAGFRVLAPDLRGYNRSDKPRGVAAYRIELIADDIAALVRHAAGGTPAMDERAALAGHDWGGIAALYAAKRHPSLVERLILLNAPHPGAFARELRKPTQWLRSSYALFFQIPWLPEWLLSARHYGLIRRVLRRDPARRDAFTDEDISRYVEALSQPGALTAALNYYRAAMRSLPRITRQLGRLDTPTLVIWGERDRFLNASLTCGLEQWLPRVRVERLGAASHWVQHDEPERVSRLMIHFLGDSGAAPGRRSR